MIRLVIEKEVGINLFSITLDGGEPIRSDKNRLLTIGDLFNFKTGTGANIIQKQKISYDEVEVIDGGSFVFTSTIQLWNKLQSIGFFDGLGTVSGGGGANTFLQLQDTFSSYLGRDGQVLVVNESEQKIISQAIALFSPELLDKLNNIQENAEVNVQADWDETNPESDSFINNKPDLSSTFLYKLSFPRLEAPQQDFEIPLNATARFAIVNGTFYSIEDDNIISEKETFTQTGNIVTFKTELEIENLPIIFYQ